MKLINFLLIALVVLFSSVGCLNNDKEKFSSSGIPLSDLQLKSFIAENNINPLDIKTTDTATIILYQKSEKNGFYVLTNVNSNMLTVANPETTEGGIPSPISVEYHNVSNGVRPFATIILNTDELQKRAYKVKITFKDNFMTEEMVNGKKGIIVFDKKNSSQTSGIQSVIIYDKEKRVLLSE